MAQFKTNEPVRLRLELRSLSKEKSALEAEIKMSRLTRTVEEKRLYISLDGFESKSFDLEFSARCDDFGGYGADVSIFEGGTCVETGSTAFDVVSSWKNATRYGFLSDFGSDENDDGDVESLLKLHINLVQFYDWVYRHDDYIPPDKDYKDLMGKSHSLDVLERKIKLCHRSGMKALGYGAVYASSGAYSDSHAQSGLYTSSGGVYKFIDIFSIMNVSPDSPWHSHIIGEYKKALDNVGFDGIHMDTYGYPKTGFSRINGEEKEERLDELFPVLIKDTRAELKKINPDCCLIFNNVCNWPVQATAKSDVDAVYIEVWEPYERYFHIQQLIAWAKYFGGGKPVILAAYLKPFKEKGCEEEAENAALLLTAVISASGGYHLLLGEKNGVLTQGYYPDYSTMRDEFDKRIRRYYDFIVRYCEILFDDTLSDVSMTHSAGDNREYIFKNAEFSPYPQAGRIFTLIKENKDKKVIHLINFTGNGDDYWNRGKKTPAIRRNIKICAEVLRKPLRVYTASPDFDGCRPHSLPFTVEDGKRGKTVTVSLPELKYWSAVVMDF